MNLPPSFAARMKNRLGAAYGDFIAALEMPAPVSIRLHPRRANAFKDDTLEQVPWNKWGRYLPERPVFTLDPNFHAGVYYVQEASSMFLREALMQSVDVSRDLKVLDLCAAPGGKSTLLADAITEGSLLVSNEVIRSRVSVLKENMEKWGYPNVAVTQADAEVFGEKLTGFFDVIITDAPCSGEGLFRKDPDAMTEWSPENVTMCAARQQRILDATVEALAPEGTLIYSTCTYNPEENDYNVAWLQEKHGLSLITLNVPESWGIEHQGGGYQFFPHKVRGEGFFIAVFRKNDGKKARNASSGAFQHLKPLAKSMLPEMAKWVEMPENFRFFTTPNGEVQMIPAALESAFAHIDAAFKSKWFGTTVGSFKGKDFVPDQALATSLFIHQKQQRLELDRQQALLFLKKEVLEMPASNQTGWTLATYQNHPLGWLKVLPNRINNYFPQERRIRMDIR
ncbi:MAG: methyltransferase domain-containing protein [Saprospiraceae bacterium]|nr:methyltransferase domain-containing protein [Saprospiraceae bacterium]